MRLAFFSFLPFLCYVLFIQWMSVKLVQYILHKLLLIIGYLLHTGLRIKSHQLFQCLLFCFCPDDSRGQDKLLGNIDSIKTSRISPLRNPISPTLCLIFRASFTVLVRTRIRILDAFGLFKIRMASSTGLISDLIPPGTPIFNAIFWCYR